VLRESFPSIIAHRGSSVEAYPNSMEAFQLAVDQKADMIELDTHLTSDGIFIIHHDATIRLKGEKYPIAKTPLKEIEKIRLPNGEKIPTLEEVLVVFLPKINFNVEIKCKITKKEFTDLIKRIDQDTSKIIVSSFLIRVLAELKSPSMEYKLAYLFRVPSFVSRIIENRAYIHSLHPDYRYLSSKAIDRYHRKKKEVNTWTINDAEHIKRLAKMGVDGIITDDPLRARELILNSLN